MNLKLKKIAFRGENRSTVYYLIEVSFGWENGMYTDDLQLHYDTEKKITYLTVKVANAGMGSVSQRVVELLGTVNFSDPAVANQPLNIIKVLSHRLGMEYDADMVREVLGA